MFTRFGRYSVPFCSVEIFLKHLKDMGWRGSIKSRYFVMALRDYYQENEGSSDSGAKTNQGSVDEWALSYLSVSRLQSISEVCTFPNAASFDRLMLKRLSMMTPPAS